MQSSYCHKPREWGQVAIGKGFASVQQIFVKHLLCSRCSSKCLKYISEKIGKEPCPHAAIVLAERNRQQTLKPINQQIH